ncbi:MAG: Ig-like domain-containing protein, partial [Clostridiales bacterium]|nr:Ig-like domain-containing protein [Clostridiales bacterium]
MNKLNKRNYLSLTSKIVLIVFVTAIMLPVFTLVSQGADNNIALADEVYGDDVDNLAQKAVYNNYEAFCNGAPVNGEQGNLGSYDAYILSKANIDVSTWVYDGESLKEKVISLINNTGEEDSARSIAYKYLAAKSWDDVAKNDLLNKLQERQTETQAADGFDQGDYSIYNNMPAFEALGRAGAIDKIDTGSAINYILNKQDTETGTWAYSNFQVTAQAVRVLKYLKPHANNQDMKDNIQSAIDKAISWISNQQQEDGSFTVSTVWDGITYWDDKVIDTAEVIYTLNILEINPGTWENEAGYSPVDYMKTGALNDDGTFGMSKNITDNTFALDAYLMVGASVDDVLIVTPYNTTISEDEEQEFAAELYDFAGSEIDVSQFAEWTVDDESVASVVYKGQVKGLSAGDTVVTATYQDLTGNANISIKESGGNNDGNNHTGTSDGPEVSVEVIGQDEESLYSGEV